MKKVLVTGAGGFLGGHVSRNLQQSHRLVCQVRTSNAAFTKSDAQQLILNIRPDTDWRPFLEGIEVVVHVAALAHRDATSASEAELLSVNVEATLKLANDALERGVRRFIFISSIGVNGDSTSTKPFTYNEPPAPHNSYASSKFLAEQELEKLLRGTRTSLVIIRPPLVYGEFVKANFLSMLKGVSRGVPLPLGGIRTNKRSLVYVGNLVDLIKVCIDHPAAANQIFLVSDDEDISTRELVTRMGDALGVKNRLLSIPQCWLVVGARLLGKKNIEKQLCGSLQVDIAHTKRTLGWNPPFSLDEGLNRTVQWFKQNRS